MSEHTKGRLHQCSHSDKRLRDEGGEWVADTDTARRKQEECSANARRLAAAWNAFDGVRTEFIEAMAGTGAMQAASDSMSSLPAALSELNAANARIAKLEALAQQQDTWLGKKTCAHSRCNELNAARALLHEVSEAGFSVMPIDFSRNPSSLESRVSAYLDACDKPGEPT